MSSGWSEFFNHVSEFLETCGRQYGTANESFSEYAVEHLIVVVQGVSDILNVLQEDHNSTLSTLAESVGNCHQMLKTALDFWIEYRNSLENENVVQYFEPQSISQGGRGRPCFSISRDQLLYMRSLSFSWVSISKLLSVSRMTIYRRRVEYGLLNDSESSRVISDEDLMQLVQRLVITHPMAGQSFIWGVVRSRGFMVTRERVRRCLRACDPINTNLRWTGILTPRQPYSVPGPNSLWHIDGNHKLIRWRLVCHGGIDGYTRMIVYLKCSSNNRANIVLENFLHAVERFGLPSRVRSDQGRENVYVARYMIQNRGQGRGSMLTGSSTHNQRIEHLWVDMFKSVTAVYYRLFYYLEQHQLLDVLNEVQLFALHYVFVPRINESLRSFQEGWNHHGIRTARHLSPQQMFLQESLRLRLSNLVALTF